MVLLSDGHSLGECWAVALAALAVLGHVNAFAAATC